MRNRIRITHPLYALFKTQSADDLVKISGKTLRTCQRWIKRGHIDDPDSLAIIQARLFGILPTDAPQWDGHLIVGGKLITPEGHEITPGDLQAAAINMQLVSAQKRAIERLEQRIDHLTGERTIEAPHPIWHRNVVDITPILEHDRQHREMG